MSTTKSIENIYSLDGRVPPLEICSLSACFGCLPITSFSQNVGLLAMTKVITAIIINIILPKDMEVSYGK